MKGICCVLSGTFCISWGLVQTAPAKGKCDVLLVKNNLLNIVFPRQKEGSKGKENGGREREEGGERWREMVRENQRKGEGEDKRAGENLDQYILLKDGIC